MATSKPKKAAQRVAKPKHGLTKSQLKDLIEEALTDAYGESEETTGFYTMMEDHLKLPFETTILETTVTVQSIDINDDDRLVAVCRKGKVKQRIPLEELPLPSPLPVGAEWIVAYQYFRKGSV
jgi:hypothetical protein